MKMKITLKNKFGTINLSGGGSRDFNITSIDGLMLPPKSYTTVSFADYPGQTTIAVKERARTITIGGDVYSKDTKLLEKLSNVLSDKVLLIVSTDRKKRRTDAKITNFEIYNKFSGYYGFVIQLEADDPYFYELNESNYNIFNRKNLITGNFVCPCVFTKRITSARIINNGTMSIYPRIKIYDVCSNGKYDLNNTLTVINKTTNSFIKLNYTTTDTETITIDFEDRSITSDINGDISYYLDKNCYLSDFFVISGENEICIENETSRQISANCLFFNRYNECI